MPQTRSSQARPRLTIGRAAERTGLSVHALRFYEREGLLAAGDADPIWAPTSQAQPCIMTS